MNNKIILATAGIADAEILFTSINELVDGNTPLVIEASTFDRHSLYAFPDTRTMQEATDLMFSNTQHLENICRMRHVSFVRRPYTHENFTRSLIEESRFADLIMCTFRALSDDEKTYHISLSYRTMIAKLECPLLLIPETSQSLMPDDLFLYDESADCIEAIKSFTYLFPHRSDHELLVYGNNSKHHNKAEMNTWLSDHYHSVKWVEQLPANGRYNVIAGTFATPLFSQPLFIYHAH